MYHDGKQKRPNSNDSNITILMSSACFQWTGFWQERNDPVRRIHFLLLPETLYFPSFKIVYYPDFCSISYHHFDVPPEWKCTKHYWSGAMPKAAHQFNHTIYLLDSKPRPVLPPQLSRFTTPQSADIASIILTVSTPVNHYRELTGTKQNY
jgi:hypothetical protein